MSITAEQMGAIIRDQRKMKNLTQQDLAQAAGVSVQAVSKWEVGQSLPDVTLLPDIADCLGLSLEALFGREGAKESEPKPAGAPFPDDGQLRVAQFLGSQLLAADKQVKDAPPMPLIIEEAANNLLKQGDMKLFIHIHGAAAISGEVRGDVSTGGSLSCEGSIGGDASAGGRLECHTVQGDASAGGSLSCGGDIQGNALAKASLSCAGSICGNASAGGSLVCGSGIRGSVHARDVRRTPQE
ncbi:MAG: helix-turn-helix transcriptional regulator [Clostridia bacterium]|nr:helix-turn-helix transcriptional regulator [Clostridia bacterium]